MRAAEPLYIRIADDFARRIRASELKAGERMPSERDLSRQWSASRMTVRQALKRLSDQNLIETHSGRGSFVGRHVAEQPVSTLAGFTEAVLKTSHRPSSIVLSAGAGAADAEAARALGLAAGAAVHRLVRVRLIDDEPVAIETTEVPVTILPDLLSLADFSQASLYAVLRAHGIHPTEAEQTLSAGLPDHGTALTLRIGGGSPVLNLSRRTLDQEKRPIEFVRSVYRGETFAMTVRLTLGGEP